MCDRESAHKCDGLLQGLGYMRDTLMSRCEQAHAGQSRAAVRVSGPGRIVELGML